MNKKSLMNFKNKARLYISCVPYLLCKCFLPYLHKKNRGKTRIIVFHHIDETASLEKIIRAVSDRYNVISFDQHLLGEKAKDKINIIIALDDGYHSWFEYGLPLFKKYSIAPLLFVSSGFLELRPEEAKVFCDKSIKTWPEAALSWQELKEMQAVGAEVGGHARGHDDLSAMEKEWDVLEKIAADRAIIEKNLGSKIRCFSYPFGRHNPTVVKSVKRSGYKYGFSSDSGFIEESESDFLIKRTNVGMRPPLIVFAVIEGWADRISAFVRFLKGKR